ncbi:Transcriptional regulator GlxA family, contains an amidase domain and an AraC-type DNA-binding HTH domain [Lentzea fradiae]|uniref:Transcriptional regulator GlxA family, contains an amidase domain and an AraC-type DNA-binding HTH domain n=1 Tax=Lentzea fradiae TaxID=200378 RepID=A0A1G7P9W1_9PSEU|nr:Transcriptional regulator GlxA family, contains an amidase domain and an AraC-type DNA-binding HTH domain [Lentzea fradiae]
MVGYDHAALLDLAGPVEVFHSANYGETRYEVTLATLGGAPFTATAGVRVEAAADLGVLDRPIDTLLVVGGRGFDEAAADPALIGHLRRLAAKARRVAGVCTGAVVLASAGLLDGKRATTHWAFTGELERRGVDVEPDAIFVCDGQVATSAGVTAGIDLSLAMVEQDHGPEVARRIAQYLVVFLQRSGGQSQFSVHTRAKPVRDGSLRALLHDIHADPAREWTVPAMARKAMMSVRHFARVFSSTVGVSPAQYVERARVEAAADLLASTGDSLDTVARQAGFGSAETLRRAFLRVLGVPPGSYRARFRTTGVA